MVNLQGKKILLTGAGGFLGKYLLKELKNKNPRLYTPTSKQFDLRIRKNCEKVVKGQDIVIHLAGNVGGIGYNLSKPGELFYDNLIMGVELMEAARKSGVEKFVTIGTVCSYPKFTPAPFKERDLWRGYPEETNAPYGLAKKALLVQAQAYRQQYNFNGIYLLLVNLYGPGDNFDPTSSHVIPALIRKFVHSSKVGSNSVEVWGTGKATREFLYVEDAARGIILASEKYEKGEPVNLGSGMQISIKSLANKIANLVGYKGKTTWNTSKPDGQPKRYLDTSKAKKEFGFKANTPFNLGLRKTLDWYLNNYD